MRTIHKIQLEITDIQTIKLPENSKILTAQFQKETLCLWAEVDTSRPIKEIQIAIIGTGNPFCFEEYYHQYIATVQDSFLVWHIFQII